MQASSWNDDVSSIMAADSGLRFSGEVKLLLLTAELNSNSTREKKNPGEVCLKATRSLHFTINSLVRPGL